MVAFTISFSVVYIVAQSLNILLKVFPKLCISFSHGFCKSCFSEDFHKSDFSEQCKTLCYVTKV